MWRWSGARRGGATGCPDARVRASEGWCRSPDGGGGHGRHDDAPPRAPRQPPSHLEEEGGGERELWNSWPWFTLSACDLLAVLLQVRGELFPLCGLSFLICKMGAVSVPVSQ